MRKTKTRRKPSSNALPADVLSTLAELDIDIDRMTGDEAWATCPGHEANLGRVDHSASWSINLNSGAHNCFSCGFGGNYVDLVRWQKDWEDEPEKAEEWTRKHGGIKVAARKMRGEVSYKKPKAEEVSEARLVMFEDRIPRWALTERDLEQDSCTAYGVKWDADNEYFILPVRDPHTGQLRGWQEKGDGHFNNFPKHLEKSDTLWGYHLLKPGMTLYVEESPLDCVRLHSWSVDGAVSGYGVHLSDVQIGLILEHGGTVVWCLDNDEPGHRKMDEIWREFRGRGRQFFANYDGITGKDHGEMTPEEIEFSIDHPISALRYRPDAYR